MGEWHLYNHVNFLLDYDNPTEIRLNPASILPVPIAESTTDKKIEINPMVKIRPDVIFPILHGPMGEDGTVQGLLKLAQIPYVGADVLGSAVGMDKDIQKRLLMEKNIPVAKYIVSNTHEEIPVFDDCEKTLGVPFFIKPANMGSSVGVSKVENENDYGVAIEKAFQFDKKILIEECIEGREIECSVLGNNDPIVSLPGEIASNQTFYSYEAKYIDEKGAELIIPANLNENMVKSVQLTAVSVFKTLTCSGLARVDFFLKNNSELYVNEINTMPGFTKISMYPKLWEVSGISYEELIDKLITLAIERFDQDKKYAITYKKDSFNS